MNLFHEFYEEEEEKNSDRICCWLKTTKFDFFPVVVEKEEKHNVCVFDFQFHLLFLCLLVNFFFFTQSVLPSIWDVEQQQQQQNIL